jgi:hypothetical protein
MLSAIGSISVLNITFSAWNIAAAKAAGTYGDHHFRATFPKATKLEMPQLPVVPFSSY